MEIAALTDVQLATLPVSGLDTAVGNTPLLPLQHITAHLPDQVQIYAKAEWFNLSGSVKDRPALSILRSAMNSGQLAHGKRLLDFNLGQYGHRLRHPRCKPGYPRDADSAGKRQRGAHCNPARPRRGADPDRSPGGIRWRNPRRRKLAAEHPERYFYANQYDNPANWQAHYFTTGPEIVQQTAGKVSHFVAGLGTSGTLTGVSPLPAPG